MTPTSSGLKFPDLDTSKRGYWAPVFLSPILGSPERFVIAVAVVSDSGFHIEQANQMRRLTCLYGRDAETALFAAEVALEELHISLAERGKAALVEGAIVFSGVTLGSISEGEARSLERLGKTWMSALSSLYRFNPNPLENELDERNDVSSIDHLPTLVLDHVFNIDPIVANKFSEEIRSNRRRRSSSAIAGISIDFNGSRLVANLATLQSSATALAVDRIKRKMFDLKVRRDKDGGLLEARDHEIILFTPPLDIAFINEKQTDRIDDALGSLREQSTNEGLGFLALGAVHDIGGRIIKSESSHALST